jgi:hypothetical protein
VASALFGVRGDKPSPDPSRKREGRNGQAVVPTLA